MSEGKSANVTILRSDHTERRVVFNVSTTLALLEDWVTHGESDPANVARAASPSIDFVPLHNHVVTLEDGETSVTFFVETLSDVLGDELPEAVAVSAEPVSGPVASDLPLRTLVIIDNVQVEPTWHTTDLAPVHEGSFAHLELERVNGSMPEMWVNVTLDVDTHDAVVTTPRLHFVQGQTKATAVVWVHAVRFLASGFCCPQWSLVKSVVLFLPGWIV